MSRHLGDGRLKGRGAFPHAAHNNNFELVAADLIDHEPRCLGAAIVGVGGGDAVHFVRDSMAAGRTAGMLHRTMHIHPTVSELIPIMLGELEP